jgi:hypothetical protein
MRLKPEIHLPPQFEYVQFDAVEAFVDPVEPLVGPALRHRLHDATVTRCLHAAARAASVLCND